VVWQGGTLKRIFHYPTFLLTLFALLCLSIGAAVLLMGWTKTWSVLQIPTLSPAFADMRTVQGAVLSDQQGLDPQIQNPGDPWNRVMNYPKVWLWIAKLLQLNYETNFLVFVCTCILAYAISCMFLLRRTPSLYFLVVIFSGASLLAVERGNNDILAFALVFAGITLSQDYGRAFSIFLAAVLKIYPVFLAVTLIKKPKIFAVLLLFLAGYFILSYGELITLQAGNTASSDPAGILASYGIDTDMRIIQQFVPGQSGETYTIIKCAFLLASILLIAVISRKQNLSFTNDSVLHTEWFLAGGIMYSSTYLLASNWDYRLIFLLLCVPYILSLQKGRGKHFLLIGILLSLNAFLLWQLLGPLGPLLGAISKYYVFVMVSTLLVSEIYRYIMRQPFASRRIQNTESHLDPGMANEAAIRKTEPLISGGEEIPTGLQGSRWRRSTAILIPLSIFAVMFVLFSIFGSNFFTVQSLINLPEQTSLLAILSLGSTLVLIVGEIDFSLGVIGILAGVAFVVFLSMGVPFGSSIALAIGMGGAVGSLNGYLVARMRLSSFIVTIGMAMLIGGLLQGLSSLSFSSQVPLPPPPSSLGDLANKKVFEITSTDPSGASIVAFPGVSWLVISMVLIALLAYFVLEHTRFGRYLFLVGSNPDASRLSGIDIIRVKSLAFVGAGMLAGVTGVLASSLLQMPSGGGNGIEMSGIICAMIGGASISGGTGNVWGTIIGAFILTILAMGLAMTPVNHLFLPTLLNGLIILCVVSLDQLRKKE
jgi:ribose transport system permease protein